jgi:hypothetical protein
MQHRLAGMSHRLRGRSQYPGGFELLIAPFLIVVLILAILGASAVPSFADANGRTVDSQAQWQSFEGPWGEEEVAPGNPHWYGNGKLLKEGDAVAVTINGTLTVTNVLGGEFTARCAVKGKGTVENPAGGGAGTDELAEFVLSNCSARNAPCPDQTELVAGNLPWSTHLIPGPPIRDVVEGVELELNCGTGLFAGSYTGTLMPTISTSVAKFGAESGELRDQANRKATVTGTVRLKGPRGDQDITARGPGRCDAAVRPWSIADCEH